ncbi:hypothetical protein ACHAXR_012078 [Thalassiosira sp. AJA248-18]
MANRPPPSTVGTHRNNNDDNDSLTSTSSSPSFCPPFQTDQALDTYLASIAPPRELICPITQELLKDPVVAEDGHTYERNSLLTWFGMGRNRSPVTNSLLEHTSTELLVTNLAVASMAVAHREQLGKELIRICMGMKEREGRVRDENGVGVRVEGLLDAGADPNGRGDNGGDTPLHLVSCQCYHHTLLGGTFCAGSSKHFLQKIFVCEEHYFWFAQAAASIFCKSYSRLLECVRSIIFGPNACWKPESVKSEH